MGISVDKVRELREKSQAGVMECRKALLEEQGDVEKALDNLKTRGLLIAEKKANRVTSQGLIESYIHTGGRLGAIVEVNCETDFVSRTDEFRDLAHELALQVAAVAPRFISNEDVPEGSENVDPARDCLLLQPYIKDPGRTVQDIITEAIAKVGENIRVRRFTRYELGT